MSFLQVLLIALSTATPARVVDASWGVLARSDHYQGAWRIDLADGSHLDGDWIVVNRATYVVRDFGGGAGPARAIHLVSSRSSVACAFDAARPLHLYCTGGLATNVRVASGQTLALERGTTQLDGGVLRVVMRPVAPTLAQEAMLFARTTGDSLAAHVRGTAVASRGALVVVMPYRDVAPLPGDTITRGARRYAQEVVEAEATIRITAPTEVAITAQVTARFIEDCWTSAHGGSSCGYHPPVCTARVPPRAPSRTVQRDGR